MATTTFHDLIDRNRRNSSLLVVTFLVLLGITVFAFAVFITGDTAAAFPPAIFALVVGGLLALLAWYRGANAVLSMSGAKEIRKEDDPQLWNIVEEISIAAGTPMPGVYLIEDTALNAFATGRDPEHAAVAVTRGLREKLTRPELQGVIAHEISHVRNYDIRFSLLLAVLVGFLALLADVFRRYLWLGGGKRRGSNRSGGRGGGAGPIVAIIAILAVILAIVAPLLGKLIQLAASRQREYLADATGVELTRYPEGLASALEKLSTDKEVLETANRATQHLYIVNPFRPFEDRAKGLFSTHPEIRERIARLRALGVGRS